MGILRKMFGPSRDEVWRQFAAEMGGKFIEQTLWSFSKVTAKTDYWTIFFDLYTPDGKTYLTRIQAPYINRDNFKFKIYENSIFSMLSKLFGAQDIEVGNPALQDLDPLFGVKSYLTENDINIGDSNFDQQFVIKGNDEEKVKSLFQNIHIRRLLESLKYVHLEITDDKKGLFQLSTAENVDILVYTTYATIKDLTELKTIYDLFAEILHHLCHLGSAYETDPQIDLFAKHK